MYREIESLCMKSKIFQDHEETERKNKYAQRKQDFYV